MERTSSFIVPVFLLIVSLALVPSLQAQMYLCENSRGVMQYTNVRSSSSCTLVPGSRSWGRKTVSVADYGMRGWAHSGLYDEAIQRISDQHRMDPRLIKAVIRAESDFNRYAVSKKGARGLMQLMPATARELQVKNSFDARSNIDGGTRYLKQLVRMFNGSLPLALAAYNAGPTVVKSQNRIPRIPETVRYVRRVLRYYQQYKSIYAMNTPEESNITIRKLVTN